MTRTLILTAALLAGCGPAEDEDASADVLAAYQAELDELQEAVDAYVAGVGSAGDVAAVADLLTTYDTDADHAIEEIEHVIEDVEGCSHMGDGAARVVDAKASLQAMHEAIEELITAHPLHTDVTECTGLAATHEQTMADEMTAMDEHHGAWGEMTCEMHDEAGEEEPHTD